MSRDWQQQDDAECFRSSLVSRNITVLGRRTSVRLEPEMWHSLREISKREKCTIHDICSLIHLRKNANTSLTAAIRVFLMLYYRAAATDDGHSRAGHGSFDHMMQRARMTSEMLRSLKAGIGEMVCEAVGGERHESAAWTECRENSAPSDSPAHC